jgi:hypothetical protein
MMIMKERFATATRNISKIVKNQGLAKSAMAGEHVSVRRILLTRRKSFSSSVSATRTSRTKELTATRATIAVRKKAQFAAITPL